MTTIVALSSGRPPAAVAIIRSSGPQAHQAAVAVLGSLPNPRKAVVCTLRHPMTGEAIDTALVLRFDAPRSATGEDVVEYQCHGGRALVTAVLDALTSLPDIRLAEPGEFTRRALANGRLDLAQAEGLADLLEAETEQQRRAALPLANGVLSRQIDRWQEEILSLSAQAEAAIDYVGDEEETAADSRALRLQAVALADEFDAWLARPRVELLKDGVRVVVAGPPNAGKSSLINALTGLDRAIVTSLAGTTRDSIEVPIAISGQAMVIVDTAGLRDTDNEVEALGVERTRAEMQGAEILLWLGDPRSPPHHPNVLRLHPKSDLGPPENVVDLSISSKTGTNLPELRARIASTASALLQPPPDGVSLNARHARLMAEASQLLRGAPEDVILLAESFRAARNAFDRVTGHAGVEDAIDTLFARFCLGK